jgi:hypothetical protein
LNFTPDGSGSFTVAAKCSVRVSNILFAERLMVPSSSDRGRTENAVKIMGIGLFLYPLANSVEHVPMDFKALITQSWVMEYTKDVIHHLIN